MMNSATLTVRATPRWATDEFYRGTIVLAHRDILRQLSSPGALITQGFQMLFFIAVYAVGFAAMMPAVGGSGFASYVYPGLVAIQLVTTGVTAGLTFAWDREYGFMREVLVSPVPRPALIAGKITGTGAITMGQCAILLAAAPLIGVRLHPAAVVVTLAAGALVTVTFCAVGLLLATLIRRVELLQNVTQLALFPTLFLSGSVFRPDAVPSWLAAVIRANPMSYAVDLLRQALIRDPFPALNHWWIDATVLAGVALLAITIATRRVSR